MEYLTVELLGVIISIIGGFVAIFRWLYKNVYVPAMKVMDSHDDVIRNIDIIKSELTPNGGSSMKDSLNRIESRQIMVDHRSKAIFYNIAKPIFEINKKGHILWANDNFHKLCGHKNLKGLDWIALIDEPEREGLLKEVLSCSDTNRELIVNTVCMDGTPVNLHGFPYREEDVNHGFLIYFTLRKK